MSSPGDSTGQEPPRDTPPGASQTAPGPPPPDPAHLIPVHARLRRSQILWRLLFFVALVIAVLALFGRFAPVDGPGDRIARVTIGGTITTSQTRAHILDELAEDEAVKAVIVQINSPGGTTAGGEELYEGLMALRAEKPVIAVIDELGASAAYMTAIATDRIIARRLSIVGSIGVLFQHVDAGKLLDTIGIDLDKVATGPLKAEPDFDEPLAGAPRRALQELVDDSFEWFVDIVAERRGLDRDTALALSDGRIFTGRQALVQQLIDGFGGETEAVQWLEAEREVAADLPVVDYYPLPERRWWEPADLIGQAARGLLGLDERAAMPLDGLVSLWQAGASN